MKYTLAILCLLLFAGCGNERAQAAADARSGIRAAMAAYAAGQVTSDIIDILRGIDARLPAASGINSDEWPAPTISPDQIRSSPADYVNSAPPEPPSAWFWGAVGAAGLGALGLLRMLAPLIPGGGPLVKTVADLAWNVMASKDQKVADTAASTVHQAAVTAKPLLDALRAMPLDSLPPAVRDALQNPSVAMAVDTLATKPRPQNV